MPTLLSKRQSWGADPNWNSAYWSSGPSEIIRYVIVGVIAVIIMVFIAGGYLHAVQRLKRKQEPLSYHRWLVSNNTRRRYGMDPVYAPGFTSPRRRNGDATTDGVNLNAVPTEQWDMGRWNYPEPPPVYNAPAQAPPEYFPSHDGESPMKAQAATVHVEEQAGSRVGGEQYAPPTGPPPSHLAPPVYK